MRWNVRRTHFDSFSPLLFSLRALSDSRLVLRVSAPSPPVSTALRAYHTVHADRCARLAPIRIRSRQSATLYRLARSTTQHPPKTRASCRVAVTRTTPANFAGRVTIRLPFHTCQRSYQCLCITTAYHESESETKLIHMRPQRRT